MTERQKFWVTLLAIPFLPLIAVVAMATILVLLAYEASSAMVEDFAGLIGKGRS